VKLQQQLDLGSLRSIAQRRVWGTAVSFGLRADVDELPPRRHAKVPLSMLPEEPGTFRGFDEELERVRAQDALEVLDRARMCREGVRELYVARNGDGEPMYAQWLVRHGDQEPLHRAVPDLFPRLGPGEALVEGAYTFVASRRLGAMADGMHQLLERARDLGDRSVHTYVSADNIPSLRGCANVGFKLDHARLTKRRLGVRSVERRPPTAAERAQWEQAVAARR
jgi:hypothetical protein